MFRVGQKVVCVNDRFSPYAVIPGMLLPKRGQVYAIRDLVSHSRGNLLRLQELVSPPCYLHEDTGEYVEAAYPAWRFRPIVDRPTDISVFKEMLHPSKIAEACDV